MKNKNSLLTSKLHTMGRNPQNSLYFIDDYLLDKNQHCYLNNFNQRANVFE